MTMGSPHELVTLNLEEICLSCSLSAADSSFPATPYAPSSTMQAVSRSQIAAKPASARRNVAGCRKPAGEWCWFSPSLNRWWFWALGRLLPRGPHDPSSSSGFVLTVIITQVLCTLARVR